MPAALLSLGMITNRSLYLCKTFTIMVQQKGSIDPSQAEESYMDIRNLKILSHHLRTAASRLAAWQGTRVIYMRIMQMMIARILQVFHVRY